MKLLWNRAYNNLEKMNWTESHINFSNSYLFKLNTFPKLFFDFDLIFVMKKYISYLRNLKHSLKWLEWTINCYFVTVNFAW